MSGHEQDALEYLEEARKLQKPKGLARFMTAPHPEIADLLEKAANSYKMARNWDKAAETFLKAAEAHHKAKSPFDEAGCYVKASQAYTNDKKTLEKGRKLLIKAVGMYMEENSYSTAAKYQKELGEVYEKEDNLPLAIESYLAAAEAYEEDKATTSANICRLKVADIHALNKEYDEAIDIYTSVIYNSKGGGAVKHTLHDYVFRCLLCYMAANESREADKALDKYVKMDRSFRDTTEYDFLMEIIKAGERQDEEIFLQARKQFISVVSMNPWKETLLGRILEVIKDAGLV